MNDLKVLKAVSDNMGDWNEVNVLAIWLAVNPNYVRRLKTQNNSIVGAALEILLSFYVRSNLPTVQMWDMLISALKELQKQSVIEELRLDVIRNDAVYRPKPRFSQGYTPKNHIPNEPEKLSIRSKPYKRNPVLFPIPVRRIKKRFSQKTKKNTSTPPENKDQSPSAPPGKTDQSPSAPPGKTDQSPSAPPEKTDQSSSAPPGKTDQSPSAPPGKTDQSPSAPTEKTDQSPSAPPEKTDQSPSAPPGKTDQSPSAPPGKTNQSPSAPPGKTDQSPSAPPGKTDQSPSAPPGKTDQSPSAPPEKTDQSPSAPPGKTDQSPSAPPGKTDQSPSAPPGKTDQSPSAPPGKTDQFFHLTFDLHTGQTFYFVTTISGDTDPVSMIIPRQTVHKKPKDDQDIPNCYDICERFGLPIADFEEEFESNGKIIKT